MRTNLRLLSLLVAVTTVLIGASWGAEQKGGSAESGQPVGRGLGRGPGMGMMGGGGMGRMGGPGMGKMMGGACDENSHGKFSADIPPRNALKNKSVSQQGKGRQRMGRRQMTSDRSGRGQGRRGNQGMRAGSCGGKGSAMGRGQSRGGR